MDKVSEAMDNAEMLSGPPRSIGPGLLRDVDSVAGGERASGGGRASSGDCAAGSGDERSYITTICQGVYWSTENVTVVVSYRELLVMRRGAVFNELRTAILRLS
jgi:hypothetical protein